MESGEVVGSAVRRGGMVLMKIYEWNIGMAATIPSNRGYNLNGWIIDEIIKDEPDCIILTEFVVSRGIEYFLSELEIKKYHWFISSSTKMNGILVALKESTFDYSDTFNYKVSPNTINNNEILVGADMPDFYEIRVKCYDALLSIIGVRIRKDIYGINPNYTHNQFALLDDYLSSLTHNVICVGDFNAYWAGKWKTPKNTTLPKTAVNFSLHTPLYNVGDWYSYVQPNGQGTQLDHLITNIKRKTINVIYDWSFINVSRYGISINANSANKPTGLPDHAILKVDMIKF